MGSVHPLVRNYFCWPDEIGPWSDEIQPWSKSETFAVDSGWRPTPGQICTTRRVRSVKNPDMLPTTSRCLDHDLSRRRSHKTMLSR